MATTMKAVQYEAGEADKMTVKTVPVPQLRTNEVLIKVYKTAINRADVIQRKGFYPPPPGESDILGLEATGIVEALGPNCSSKWKKGDRVMTLLAGGGYAEYVANHEDLLMKVPSSLTFTQAAAIPEVWLTAFQLLHEVGKIQKDEKVLVHAGGSGVGTAAVQLIKLAGSTPIVTAGSQTKIDTAKSLGAVEGFNYKELSNFSEEVKKASGGKGVNLILDCIGSSFYEENLNSLAVDGRWVLYGLLGGRNVNSDFLGKLLAKRVSLLATTLRTRSIPMLTTVISNAVTAYAYCDASKLEMHDPIRSPLQHIRMYKAKIVRNFEDSILPKFVDGTLKTVIDKEFDFQDIVSAHKLMESNANTGKIIIKVQNEDKQEL